MLKIRLNQIILFIETNTQDFLFNNVKTDNI